MKRSNGVRDTFDHNGPPFCGLFVGEFDQRTIGPLWATGGQRRLDGGHQVRKSASRDFLGLPGTVSAQLAIAQPRRIKATHRRRRKVAAGHFVQRYYDPAIGRFLSVDPMATDTTTGWNFNRYNYAANNPYKFTDPDGRSIWTKLFKLVKSGGNLAQVTAGVVSDFKTIADPSASTGDKVLAGASMISEALPLSLGDAKDVKKALGKIPSLSDKAVDKAVKEGRASRYEAATTGKSVANRETGATAESMRDNLSDSGYSSTRSKDGSTEVFTNGESSYVIRTDKDSVDFRNNADGSGKPELKIRIKEE